MILDLEKALKDGAVLPTKGIFHGERVHIVSTGPATSVWIEFADNDLYKGQRFLVDFSHLITEET